MDTLLNSLGIVDYCMNGVSDPIQLASYVRVYLDLSFVHVVSVTDIKQALP